MEASGQERWRIGGDGLRECRLHEGTTDQRRVEDIEADTAEQRGDMTKLPKKSEFVVPPLWTETREDREARVKALLEGIGSGAVSNPVMDVLQAEVVLLIGANPVSNHPVAATWIKNAVKKGTKLILADPRRSELARHAHPPAA